MKFFIFPFSLVQQTLFFQEPTMHKIVLTILHVFTDLILWEDRHRDNFKNQDVLSLFFFFFDRSLFLKFFYLFIYLYLIIFL